MRRLWWVAIVVMALASVARASAGQTPAAPVCHVQGAVQNPGVIQWEANLTIERAIVKAGGRSMDATPVRVTLSRTDPKTGKMRELDLGKDPLKFIVQPDDLITVPRRRM